MPDHRHEPNPRSTAAAPTPSGRHRLPSPITTRDSLPRRMSPFAVALTVKADTANTTVDIEKQGRAWITRARFTERSA